jgi:hypothetical protein
MTKKDWQQITVLFIGAIILFVLQAFILMIAWNFSIAAMGIAPRMEYIHALWFLAGTNVIQNAAKGVSKND